MEGGKPGSPGKKPLEQGENQQQTQPIYGTGPASNSGHIAGRWALYCSMDWSITGQVIGFLLDFVSDTH